MKNESITDELHFIKSRLNQLEQEKQRLIQRQEVLSLSLNTHKALDKNAK